MEPDITSTSIDDHQVATKRTPCPALLIAYAQKGISSVDRCRVAPPFSVGRNADNDLAIADHKISGHHFRITSDHRAYVIEDLGSTNGTFLNGERLNEPALLNDQAVIRAGRTLLIFHNDAPELLAPPPLDRFGMAGSFHVGGILCELEEAARSMRHLLILGPSGSGKELAAKAVAAMSSRGRAPLPLLPHNAARFSSEEEATSTLFGVGARVFSNVNPRPGLIEQAEGGVLFLDEIHNLTVRVQRSLLRVIEDREYTRLGDTGVRKANVRFVFASNAEDPERSMANDLFARLRLVRMPPLRERVADIPAIFMHVLKEKLAWHGLEEASVISALTGEHFEILVLDGFAADNVRGLIDIADRIATKIGTVDNPSVAIFQVFSKRFEKAPATGSLASIKETPPVTCEETQIDESESADSTYEQNKALIIATFRDREENISATMRVLRAYGISCSRRWLAAYLKKWGVKKID